MGETFLSMDLKMAGLVLKIGATKLDAVFIDKVDTVLSRSERFVAGITEKTSEIRNAHGDDKAKTILQSKFKAMLPDCHVIIPGN